MMSPHSNRFPQPVLERSSRLGGRSPVIAICLSALCKGVEGTIQRVLLRLLPSDRDSLGSRGPRCLSFRRPLRSCRVAGIGLRAARHRAVRDGFSWRPYPGGVDCCVHLGADHPGRTAWRPRGVPLFRMTLRTCGETSDVAWTLSPQVLAGRRWHGSGSSAFRHTGANTPRTPWWPFTTP